MTTAKPRVVAIIQARCSSSRLPGKVMMDIAGQPMLVRVLSRVARAARVSEVVVATSVREDDDPVEALCRAHGFRCVRGSLEDVLDRYAKAAREAEADVVVRITSDCPLIDPAVIDRVVEAFVTADPAVQYASNVWPARTFPRGLDTEVFSRAALEQSARDAVLPPHREHVTQYILAHPEVFSTVNVLSPHDEASHRWTVDVPEDLELVRRIYAALAPEEPTYNRVRALLEQNPSWRAINEHVEQKKV